MLHSDRPRYRVIESERFQAEVERIIPDVRRWDEIRLGIDDLITRNPLAFEAIPGTTLRAVTINLIPTMTVYFRVLPDDGVIRLEAMIWDWQQ